MKKESATVINYKNGTLVKRKNKRTLVHEYKDETLIVSIKTFETEKGAFAKFEENRGVKELKIRLTKATAETLIYVLTKQIELCNTI